MCGDAPGRRWRAPTRRIAAGLAASLGLGCADASEPTPASPVAGPYVATSIVRQQDGLSDELVDQGATLQLVLEADSSLSGRAVLPANLRARGASDPVDQLLGGRWSLTRNQITLRLDQPLLGNQPTLAAVGGALVGTLIVPDPLNGTLWLKLLLTPDTSTCFRPCVAHAVAVTR